jgi:hypothetical protein
VKAQVWDGRLKLTQAVLRAKVTSCRGLPSKNGTRLDLIVYLEYKQKYNRVSKPSQNYAVRLIIRKTLRALLKIDSPIP